MKKFSLILFATIPMLVIAQQENPFEYEEEHTVLLKKEFEAGPVIHSNGWGLVFRRGENTTVSKKKMYEIEVVGMKHPKEYKTISYLSEKPKSFVFGKLNSLLVTHGGYSKQYVLFGKTDHVNIEIRANLTGGVSLGFTKPVYLVFVNNDNLEDPLVTEKYNPDNPDHALESIYGRAEFTKGLDELKVYPGLYLKAGTTFEYAPLSNGVKALEAGIMLDAYGKKIPIMAFAKNKQVFFNFYLTIMLGRKW